MVYNDPSTKEKNTMFAVIWKTAVGTLTVLATVMAVGGVVSAAQHL